MAEKQKSAGSKTTDRLHETAQAAADMAKDGAQKARDAFQDHVVDPAKRAGEALHASGQRLAESGAALGSKVIDQAEANAREAFAAMRAAANARDVTEIMRIQGDFLREQGQRSMAQAREIGELIARFGRHVVAPMRGEDEPPDERG